jgi:hypothetical protein
VAGHNIEDLKSRSAQDEFWALRGKAIASYANIERSLCHLLSSFGGMETSVAETIFYRVADTRKMGIILTKLLKKKHGSKYSVFWKSFAKHVQQLTVTRNQIVHWNVALLANDKGYAGISLMPPDVLNNMQEGIMTILPTSEIAEFMEECDFVWRLCNMFFAFLEPSIGSRWNPELHQTWLDIFQRPIDYPVPPTHPLFPKPSEPVTPLPPSPESPQSPP